MDARDPSPPTSPIASSEAALRSLARARPVDLADGVMERLAARAGGFTRTDWLITLASFALFAAAVHAMTSWPGLHGA